MQTVEFFATINNGKIDVPVQYRDEFNSEVKVTLLKPVRRSSVSLADNKKTAKGFGALAHRANPNLWAQEE